MKPCDLLKTTSLRRFGCKWKERKAKGSGLRTLEFAVCTVKGFRGEGENDDAVRGFSSSNVDYFLFSICLR